MQSPLQQLLQAAVAHCDLDQIATLQQQHGGAERLADAARSQLEQLQLFSEVLEVLLQAGVQGCVADPEHVASCKARAGAAFGRQQFAQAATLYTEALRYGDERTTEGAQLAARLYCNRALCQARLRRPALEAAHADASAAMDCEPAFDKAYYRRAAVAVQLGRPAAEPLADLRRARELQQQRGGAVNAEVQALLEELEQGEAAGEASDGGPHRPNSQEGGAANGFRSVNSGQPVLANGLASPAAAAASALEALVQQVGPRLVAGEVPGAGRALSARVALEAGADVLQERPFAHALTKKGRRTRCSTCLVPLPAGGAPFYCRSCPLPGYCSRECRQGDPWHTPGGAECGLPWPVLLPEEAVTALRLARAVQQEGDSALGRHVASLETHLPELPAAEAARLAALVVVAQAAWQQAAAAQASEQQQQQQQVSAGGVLIALCQLRANGLAVVPPERGGCGEDRAALAIYPVASLMNHACLPNVAARFEAGHRLVVRTLADIPAGAPLLLCYGPQAGEMVAEQRQRMLQHQYHFACACEACSSNSAAAAEAAMVGLRCFGSGLDGPRCDGVIIQAGELPAGLVSRYELRGGSGCCSTCGAALQPEEWEGRVRPQLQQAAEAYAAAMTLLEEQQARSQEAAPHEAALPAIRHLRQCLRDRQQLLHPSNQLLGQTHDGLARAWHAAGNPQAAADHVRHSLGVLRRCWAPGSTAVAFQQRKLAQLLAAAASSGGSGSEDAGEEAAALVECRRALTLHFGTALAEQLLGE